MELQVIGGPSACDGWNKLLLRESEVQMNECKSFPWKNNARR